MKLNYFSVVGIAFIAYYVGAAVSDIGEIPKCSTEQPYNFILPLIIFWLTALPFVFGYLAGIQNDKEKGKDEL